MKYRVYLAALLLPITLIAIVCTIVGLFLDPVIGDLTRLGGYSEKDFGWNGTEYIYSPPLAAPGSLSSPADIVVFGDSFSFHKSPDRQTPIGGYWVDQLAAETGLSVIVFDVDQVRVETYINSPIYGEHPPRFIIYESGERELKPRLTDNSCKTPTSVKRSSISNAHKIEITPIDVHAVPVQRLSAIYRDSGFFGRSISYLTKNIKRNIFDIRDIGGVKHHRLTRSDLFTSYKSTEFLAYGDDERTADWSQQDWDDIQSSLICLQENVQSNGTTRFLIVIAPDKTSAYGRYLAPPLLKKSTMEYLMGSELNLVPVESSLKKAIEEGVQDVYLPNDTHWGTVGSKIAARAVVDYLTQP